jgi:hypothetical protein
MKKLKVLMMGGMLAAGICLFAACGTANDDGTNNGVNDTSNTQVTTQENIPGTDNTTGNGTTDNNTDAEGLGWPDTTRMFFMIKIPSAGAVISWKHRCEH